MNWTVIVSAAFALVSTMAHADECWIASNVKGHSALSIEDYGFIENGPAGQPFLVCFTSDAGTVTGNDIPLVKFGDSTLAGFAGNERGLQAFVVYQVDRERRKLLFTRSRIGTATVTPVLPDLVEAFVGDVVRAPQ